MNGAVGASGYGDAVAFAGPDWIGPGTRFGVDEMVFFRGKGTVPFDDVLERIDLVISGPHATAAFPAELQPFVDPSLTQRLQYDFSDWSTSPVARRWAAVDPHVLYIEDPHPRAVRDANRPRPTDLLAALREAFDRLAADPTGHPSLAGVDAVRPVTFGYLPVLRRPSTNDEWEALGAALLAAGTLGVDPYEACRDQLIERVVAAKVRHLADADPQGWSPAEWHSATHLDVLSIHDTMNTTARPDGAVCLERQPADRLPELVALSNRGDAAGERRAEGDEVSMPAPRLRSIGQAYRDAFGVPDHHVAYNRPYLGGHETQLAGPRLRELAVEHPGLHLAAWQNEFLREFLLGPEACRAMHEPGDAWVPAPDSWVNDIADRLAAAHAAVRLHGTALDRGV
ncbi:MAG: hypothetical protein RL238_3132 [Actinomycetota bacterium]